ncbi:hypothetical protein G6F31_018017 [Rhizopus arrhizus]|nr:hypothetical protein G6F31_018017 [Rhizopus arrhizus]
MPQCGVAAGQRQFSIDPFRRAQPSAQRRVRRLRFRTAVPIEIDAQRPIAQHCRPIGLELIANCGRGVPVQPGLSGADHAPAGQIPVIVQGVLAAHAGKRINPRCAVASTRAAKHPTLQGNRGAGVPEPPAADHVEVPSIALKHAVTRAQEPAERLRGNVDLSTENAVLGVAAAGELPVHDVCHQAE